MMDFHGESDASRFDSESFERRTELDALTRWFDAGRGVVVSVVGPRGSGKSFVVDAVARRAVDLGWAVTPYEDARGVRVGGGTTAAELLGDVCRALGEPAVAPGRRPLRALLSMLEHAGDTRPTLVIFDPYAPDDGVRRGLEQDFFPSVRKLDVPVVVLVVCRSSVAERTAVDGELVVSAPEADRVRSSLCEVADAAHLALEPGELEQYVEAARTSPRLLTSLLAVLPLGATPMPEHVPRQPTGVVP